MNSAKYFKFKDSQKYNLQNIFKNNLSSHWFDNQNDNGTAILYYI